MKGCIIFLKMGKKFSHLHIGFNIQKGGNLAEILEALIEASEHSFCITYQNSFRREGIQAQVQGAIFERKESSPELMEVYIRLKYVLKEDDPMEVWIKEFPRKEINIMPQGKYNLP